MSFRFMSVILATILLSVAQITISAPTSFEAEVNGLARRINHEGRGTFFYPGMGNCGYWNDSKDPIIAISTEIYNDGANCDQWVEITNMNDNSVAYGLVRDSCPSCASGSLDMSPAVFQLLAPLSQGVIPIKWHYMPRGFSP